MHGGRAGARLAAVRAVKAFRRQAQACAELGSPMYAELLDRLADDIEVGGPTAEIVQGHEDDPGPSALALRLLGSVHRLVLERRAGALGAFYPSVGGTWEPDGGVARSWPCSRVSPMRSGNGSTGHHRPTRWVAPRR